MGTFPGYNAEATDAQYARVSKISVDSFDSSSTSSGECYENTNGYVTVTPGQSNSFACFPLTSSFAVQLPLKRTKGLWKELGQLFPRIC